MELFTSTSSWTWLGHLVSGLWQLTFRAIHTRFPFASGTECLKLASYYNSPDRSTKSTTPPFNGLCLLVSTRFQVLFHSPPGVLFTFPSRYCSSIGHQVVFWLGGWSPGFPRDSSCPAVLWIRLRSLPFRLRGSHTLWRAFPNPSSKEDFRYRRPQPRSYCYDRFGLFRFRSPLLSESRLITFPRPT